MAYIVKKIGFMASRKSNHLNEWSTTSHLVFPTNLETALSSLIAPVARILLRHLIGQLGTHDMNQTFFKTHISSIH
jgi:hypothetical protein